MTEHYDIAIIGAGPGGYPAAIRAAQLGFKTVCIDKRDTLGGTCLNVGCIPSKALLQSTELLVQLKQESQVHGIECGQVNVDFSQMMARKRQIVHGLVEGVAGLFKKNGVLFIKGQAEFLDIRRLKITQGGEIREIEADFIILATGSEPMALPHLPFDGNRIISSTEALSLAEIPKRLLVVGGGVIGVEMASVYNRLGSQVLIIEMLDRLCPPMDLALSKGLLQSLKRQGIEIKLSSRVVSAVVQPDEVLLTVEEGDKLINISGEMVLVAVGRRPYTQGLGLEKIGIALDRRGFVPVDSFFRTQQSHIFAIGDLIEGPMLAHRASEEGMALVEWLKGQSSPIHYLSIPNVVYTDPELASVGLTEQEAKEAGLHVLIGTAYFKGNGRARCSGTTEGLVKVIGDQETGRLVGMHIIGPHASELIAEGMLAMQKGCTLREIGEAVNAHPTLSEVIKEAALQAIGQPIHA